MCVHVMSNLIQEYSRPFINSGPIITSDKFLNKNFNSLLIDSTQINFKIQRKIIMIKG